MLTDEQRHAVYEVRYRIGPEAVDWEYFKEQVDGLGFGADQDEAQDLALYLSYESAEIHCTSRLKSIADMQGRQRKPSLVRGLIPVGGFGRMNGESAAGKSFVVLDLMLSITRDVETWLDLEIYKHGNVIYAMTEGTFDFADRVAAWEIGHPDAKPVEGQDLYVIDQELGDLASTDGGLALVEDMAAVDPVLLVIDTQRGALPNTEENDNTPWNALSKLLKDIANEAACAIMLVHHTPKAGGELGSGASSVRANCDFELFVETNKDGSERKVKGTKAKYGPLPPEHTFTLNTVDIDGELDEAGNQVNSCWAELKPARKKSAAELVREATVGTLVERIEAFLRIHPGAGLNAVRQGLGGNAAATTAELRRLTEDGQVEVREDGQRRLHYWAEA